MPRLRWTDEGVRFTDHPRNFIATAGEYDIDDEDRAEQYLGHPSGGWARVEEDDGDTDDEESGGDEESNGVETLIGADRATLETADYSRLRRAAMSDDVDGVDGRSSKGDIIDALADE